jgi:hypothetical protein
MPKFGEMVREMEKSKKSLRTMMKTRYGDDCPETWNVGNEVGGRFILMVVGVDKA